MPVRNWTPMFKKYGGQWVALKEDEATVIAHATSIKDLRKKAAEAGYEKPIFFKVPSKMIAYIGSASSVRSTDI